MHLYDQTFDDGQLPYSRALVLIQNPRTPDPANLGGEEQGIIEADVAVFLSFEKADRSPALVLQSRFILLRKAAQLTIRYPSNDTAFPGADRKCKEQLWARFSDAVSGFLGDVVRRHFPERAYLL
jgi:hypothetical protein